MKFQRGKRQKRGLENGRGERGDSGRESERQGERKGNLNLI